MKVLFAVSNEEISEAIVKRYQKEYKEIISYKNVYYFNAILKEVQKEKSYDRIVISEELESFGKSEQVEVDSKIFDKLDSISDEAVDLDGKDIPIVVIASDRRRQSDEMVVKLFGIGIYNALIGSSRSIEEVCKLIKKPRIKKEAKRYYSLDTDDVSYQSVSENDVSEEEIQNILSYYKKLGNDEEQIVQSFVSLSAQYNATQIRIIGKVLPAAVRDVLGRKSVKYQQLMGFGSSFAREEKKSDSKTKELKGATGTLLKTEKKSTKINNVVIPTNIKMDKTKKLLDEEPDNDDIEEMVVVKSKVTVKAQEKPVVEEIKPIEPEVMEEIVIEKEEAVAVVKKGRGRPKKVVAEVEEPLAEVKKGRGRPKKIDPQESSVEPLEELNIMETMQQVSEVEEEDILEGLIPEIAPLEEDVLAEELLPGIESVQENIDINKIKAEVKLETIINENGNNKITQQYMINEFNGEEQPIKDYRVEVEEEVNLMPGLDEFNQEEPEEEFVLPEIEIEEEPEEEFVMPSIEEPEEIMEMPMPEIEPIEEEVIPFVMEEEEPAPRLENVYANLSDYQNYIQEIDLTSLLMGNKKIVSFVGASKNGNSFLVNNVAQILASKGVDVALLDATKNRSAYFVYTNNDESLRKIAETSIGNLSRGNAAGIEVDRNLTVYTSTVEHSEDLIMVDQNLETLIKKHDIVLIDCDFETPYGYYKQSQEIYLVQSYDILTIQPFTAFLRILKDKEMLEESKIRIVLNKAIKIRGITDKTIIGGMAFYRDPSMSYMTELFDRNTVKYVSVPFDKDVYIRYLEGVINCEISHKGYSKMFINTLNQLAGMVFPALKGNPNLPAKRKGGNVQNQFTNNMDNTLDQMKKY